MNTKEFATLCGVEKRTLFHYDEIGLLKPSSIRENGCIKMYSAQIIRVLPVISGKTLLHMHVFRMGCGRLFQNNPQRRINPPHFRG